MIRRPVERAALAALAAGAACSPPARDAAADEGSRSTIARATGTACDSARAAHIALDSLARLDPFSSAVSRFDSDSTGVRIVTGPARADVLDGAAVVRVDRGCRIVSLVQTDSA
jgi:hypothetical protein